MPHQSAIDYLRQAISVSKKSRDHGNTPFGAILVNSEGTVILEQENIEITQSNCTGHAETTLMEAASQRYSKSFLWNCTLYTTAEPCAMCAGAIYWGNVGKVVYGISEERLLTLTGDNEQNPTFNLACREVFSKGQNQITVVGPFPELEEEIVAVHEGYWK